MKTNNHRQSLRHIHLSILVMGIVLVGLLIAPLFRIPESHAQPLPNFQSEFSVEGESVERIDTWAYTSWNGHSTLVDVYKYCSIECVLVAFDITNSRPLDEYDAVGFFQNYAISSLIFSDAPYQSPYSTSEICTTVIPEFKSQLGSLAVKAAEQGGETYMSAQDVKYLKMGIRTFRTLGYLGEFSIATFGFAAVCLGSTLFESSVADELKKCHEMIQESKRHVVSYYRAGELIECNNTLAKKLEESKASPNVWFKNAEIFFGNIWSRFDCISSRDPCPPAKRYVTDIIDEMIPAVKAVSSQVSMAIKDAQQDATISDRRIALKMSEASAAINALDSEYSRMTAKLEAHQWGNWVWDQFKTPVYDLAEVERIATPAVQKHGEAHSSLNSYRFNSALKAANDGLEYTRQTLAVLDEHEAVVRQWDIGRIILVFGLPIAALVGIFFIRKRR